MKISFILTAAGNGSRMGAEKNKTLLEIDGKTILQIALEQITALNFVDEIIISFQENDLKMYKAIAKNFGTNKIKFVKGGDTRSESVFNALKSIKQDFEAVMVHDAARPFLGKHIFYKLVDALKYNDFVIPILRTKDTILDISEEAVVLNRNNVVAVQTPQCFKKSVYKNILHALSGNKVYSDESSIALDLGLKLFYVDGSQFLNKITVEEDLEIAKAIYKVFLKNQEK